MKFLKIWLENANGWKRLWFSLTILLFLYVIFINPFFLTTKNSSSSWEYRWAVERELKNPECKEFSEKPLSELVEPEYQDLNGEKGCYHIFNQRKYNNPTKIPYTAEDVDSDFKKELWGEILLLSGLGFLGAAIFSGVAYFLGIIVAWIISGFKGSSK